MIHQRIEAVEAYPLAWPEGWTRTPAHLRADGSRFRHGSSYAYDSTLPEQRRYVGQRPVTFDVARKKLGEELDRLKAINVTLSTNVPLRLDGNPRAGEADRRLMDPGVAVYFTYKGRPMVMAQDAFDSAAANVRSLGLAIEALRQLDRHGGGTMMERAFAGFTALPAPDSAPPRRPWWIVLNYGTDPEARADLTADEVVARFRALAKKRHPDTDGGSAAAFAELSTARDEAVRDLGG